MEATIKINLDVEGSGKVKVVDQYFGELSKKANLAAGASQKLSANLQKLPTASISSVVNAFVKLKAVIVGVSAAIVGLTSSFHSKLYDAVKRFGDVVNNLKAVSFDNLQNSVNQMAGAFIEATLKTGEFSKAISNVASVVGASQKEIELLKQAAIDYGAKSVFSANQAAEAMYYLGSAGFKTKQVINALGGVLNFAAATQTGLGEASQLVVSILNQFSLSANQASRVADVLANTIRNSQATSQKLAYSFRYVGAVAKQMGLSLEETSAALGVLYNAGFDASTAGTALRGVLLSLVNPTKNLKNFLSQAGLTFNDVNPRVVGFEKAIQNLIQTINNIPAENRVAVLTKVFGRESVGAVLALTKNFSQLNKLTAELEAHSKNVAASMAKIQINNLAGQITLLKSAFESLQLSIGKTFEGTAMKSVQVLTSVVQSFITAWQKIDFTGVINQFTQLNSVVENSKGLIAQGFTEAINTIVSQISGTLGAVLDTLQGQFHNVKNAIVGFASLLSTIGAGTLQGIIDGFAKAGKILGTDFVKNLSNLRNMVAQMVSAMITHFTSFIKIISSSANAISEGFKGVNKLFSSIGENAKGIGEVIASVFKNIGAVAVELSQWIGKIDFSSLGKSLSTVKDAAVKFVGVIGKVVSNEKLLAGFAATVSGAFKTLAGVFATLNNVFGGKGFNIEGFVQNIQAGVNNLLNSIKAIFSKINISQILKGAFDIGEALIKLFTDGIKQLTDWLGKAVNSGELANAIGGFFNDLVQLLNNEGFRSKILSISYNLGKALGLAIKEAFLALIPLTASLTNILGRVISGAVAGLVAGVFDFLAPLVEALAKGIERVMEELAKRIPVIGPAIKKVWDVLKNLFFDAIGAIFAPAVLVNLVGKIAPSLAEFVSALQEVLSSKLGAALTKGAGIAKDAIVKGFSKLKEAFPNIISSIKGALPGLSKQLVGAFNSLKDSLSGAIKGLFSTEMVSNIKTGLLSLGTAIKKGISGISEVLKGLMGIFDNVAVSFRDAFSLDVSIKELLPKITTGLGVLVASFKEPINNLITLVISSMDKFKDAILGAFDGEKYVNALFQFIGELQKNLNELLTSITGWGQKFSQAFIGLWSDLQQKAIDAVKAVWDGIKKAWGDATAWLKGSINAVKAWVDGFVNTIKSVIDKVKGVASKLKNMLMGHSPPPEGPLKELDKGAQAIGKTWTQNLIAGLQSLNISEALVNINKTLQQPINPSLAVGAVPSKGNVIVNINDAQILSPEDYATFSLHIEQAVRRAIEINKGLV